jgi:DNA repair photolyase
MRVHNYTLGTQITRTGEFAKKGLATHAVNVGTKCGHDCAYCSTGALLRRHRSYEQAGENPFKRGYAIVDPSTPERVARAARRIQDRGMVQLCTQVDAWAPEAQAHDLGRRCLQAILDQPGWSVRILTKDAAVVNDFDLIERYRDRVLVGLSITAPPDNAGPVSALEPNASSIEERLAALTEAHRRGLRTYGMFCPLLPGISDSRAQVDWLIEFAVRNGVEEIFAEAVNPRGSGLGDCADALRQAGFDEHAADIDAIRNRARWSRYVTDLISTVQASVREHFDVQRLRFLLYPSRLTPTDREQIKRSDDGVVWLGKSAASETRVQDAMA